MWRDMREIYTLTRSPKPRDRFRIPGLGPTHSLFAVKLRTRTVTPLHQLGSSAPLTLQRDFCILAYFLVFGVEFIFLVIKVLGYSLLLVFEKQKQTNQRERERESSVSSAIT